jgi:hypothetical protein
MHNSHPFFVFVVVVVVVVVISYYCCFVGFICFRVFVIVFCREFFFVCCGRTARLRGAADVCLLRITIHYSTFYIYFFCGLFQWLFFFTFSIFPFFYPHLQVVMTFIVALVLAFVSTTNAVCTEVDGDIPLPGTLIRGVGVDCSDAAPSFGL